MEIRHLTTDDVPAAMELVRQAGWNQVPADWHRLLDLEPDGCFGGQVDGVPFATDDGRPLYRSRGFADVCPLEQEAVLLDLLAVDAMTADLERLGLVRQRRLTRMTPLEPRRLLVGPELIAAAGFEFG